MSFICSVCQAKNRLKLNLPSRPKSILYLFQFGLIKVYPRRDSGGQNFLKKTSRFSGTNLEISQQNWSFTDGPGAGENPATSLRTGMMVEIGELSQTRPNYSDS